MFPFSALCELSSTVLPTVDSGSWNPSSGSIAYGETATLTCAETYSKIGAEGVTCGNSGKLDLNSVPSCVAKSESKCEQLADPANGKVIYIDANSVYYKCNSGYALFNSRADVRWYFNLLLILFLQFVHGAANKFLLSIFLGGGLQM